MNVAVLVFTALLGATFGWLACRARASASLASLGARLEERDARLVRLEGELIELQALRQESTRLTTELASERRLTLEKVQLLEQAERSLRDAFQALSAEALRDNSQAFLNLAKLQLGEFQTTARADLESRREAINTLVGPLAESLRQVDGKLQEVEKDRLEAYSELRQQLAGMAATQQQLGVEAGKLVKALRAPNVRGRWGEIQLGRVVEMAGMVSHCDFNEQQSVQTEDGRLRPDMVVRLPGAKNVVVDAKAPLSAYLEALEAPDDVVRAELLEEHARQVRTHMTMLGSKGYWEQFEPTPEFVVMFLPGETFFSAALQQDPALIEYGVSQRVIPASPTTLIALLRAVAYGWRQETLAKNAQAISDLGRTLYERLGVMVEHFNNLRKHLDQAVAAYNKTAASFEGRVVATARKFKELGATSSEELKETAVIERTSRPVDTDSLELATAVSPRSRDGRRAGRSRV